MLRVVAVQISCAIIDAMSDRDKPGLAERSFAWSRIPIFGRTDPTAGGGSSTAGRDESGVVTPELDWTLDDVVRFLAENPAIDAEINQLLESIERRLTVEEALTQQLLDRYGLTAA
jgi:hypothetical protein